MFKIRQTKRNINLWVKDKLWFFFEDEKCEFCRGKLRRRGDKYYGGIEVYDTIGKTKSRTSYVCNLCYSILKNIK